MGVMPCPQSLYQLLSESLAILKVPQKLDHLL